MLVVHVGRRARGAEADERAREGESTRRFCSCRGNFTGNRRPSNRKRDAGMPAPRSEDASPSRVTGERGRARNRVRDRSARVVEVDRAAGVGRERPLTRLRRPSPESRPRSRPTRHQPPARCRCWPPASGRRRPPSRPSRATRRSRSCATIRCRQVGADEPLVAARGRLREVGEAHGVAVARAARRVGRLRRVDGAQRTDGRRLVARHAGAEQTGHRDRRDDADDRHDDQQLDEGEALGVRASSCS